MELAGRNVQPLAHPAVHVHPEHLQPLTAVPASTTAGRALLAVEIRFDGAAVTGPDGRDIGSRLANLNAELVAEDPRIREERLPAAPRVKISAADTDAPDANQGAARRERAGRIGVDGAQVAGFVQDYGAHAGALGLRAKGQGPRAKG